MFLSYLTYKINLMSISVTELASSITLKDSISFTLNMEALNSNFEIVKQCLLKIRDLESTIGRSKQNTSHLEERVKKLEDTTSQNGNRIQQNQAKIQQLSNNVGDDFMNKMYGIEEKTKNMFDFDETVRRLQTLNKFVLVDNFNVNKQQVSAEFERVWKLKDEFNRYVLNVNFNKYQEEQDILLGKKQAKIDETNATINKIQEQIDEIKGKVSQVSEEIQQNNNMIKEIDFAGLLDKIMMFKEETQKKVAEMTIKLKKKVSHAEIFAFEKSMVEKLDKFFMENEKNKAEKVQTKDALLFLEKKIIQIESLLLDKFGSDDSDPLFASKRWQCASCTKDLGKYEGKLGQYLPWSIFPCKEMNPEQSGGFGYLNYIDKMSFKKGVDVEDQQMQRMNKTFYDPKEKTVDSPIKRMNQTRASNLISNYGSEQRSSSLKQAYFRDMLSEKGQRPMRSFRVSKKEPAKSVMDIEKKDN